MLIQLLIIQIITFVALLFLLRYIFSRNLNSALGRLNSLHEENQVKEAQLSDELKRAKEEREAEVARGKAEASDLIEEAKKEASRARIKVEEGAKAQADKIIAQGKREAGDFKEKLNKEMQVRSLDLALKMVEQTFTEENKEDLQRQFITEIIDEIAKLPKDKFTVSTDKVKVVSSYPLQDEQRENLKKVLGKKLGANISLEEKVKKELISGLILEMGGLVVDGTLKNRLHQAIPELLK